MFISIHIPKTAGTSLGYIFDYSSGRRVFWDYDPTYKFARDVQPEIEEHIEFIKSYFSFIHGHFHYAKYSNLLTDEKFITCIRHPVDRVVSQYYHIAYEGNPDDWRVALIREGKMNVVDFARSDKNISAAMFRHLQGRDIEHYDHVFITERLHESLVMFSKKYDFRILAAQQKLNDGMVRKVNAEDKFPGVSQVTDAERSQVFNVCLEDVDLYQRGVEAFTKEKGKYL